MNVIHLISGGDVGGAKTHVLSLLAGLHQTQNVQLVCFTEGEFADDARRLQIPTAVIASKNIFHARDRLLEIIQQGKYEIIHCHGARANLMGVLLKKKLSLPVVTTVHSDYRLDYLGRPLGRLTYGTINTLALRKLDNWIGVSESMRDLLVQRGFDVQRVFSIYNGVDFSARSVSRSREEYLSAIGLQADSQTTVFGIAARISPIKDMTTLITAFSEAVRYCPNIRLAIAGDGEQAEQIRQLAEKTCPKGSVAFVGWESDMDSFYNALDVNMLTSLSEGFPYALPEGARWHCTAIATDVGGIPLLIDDGINGLLFKPQDVAKLSAHIQYLANNPDKRREMSDLLYQKALELCSVEATVEKQLQIYQTILRRRARKNRKRDGVFICGAYGQGNGGDDVILETIVAQLRQIDPDLPLYVVSRKPIETALQVGIRSVYTFRLLKIARIMKRTKLYLSGGGTLMQDVTSTRSLLFYLQNLCMAKKRGNKTMLFGCGIGPISHRANRKKAGTYLNRYADVITLRDDYSRQTLLELGVTRPKILLTADPALLCSAQMNLRVRSYLQANSLDPEKKYAMFALRPWPGLRQKQLTFARAAEYTYRSYGLIPVFFGMEPEGDIPAMQAVVKELSCPYLLLPAPKEKNFLLSVIAQMELVVSMRLHALIFAAGQGVPMAGIVYDPKVSAFLEYIGQKQYLPLDEVADAPLTALIDKAFHAGANTAVLERMHKLAERNQAEAALLLQE